MDTTVLQVKIASEPHDEYPKTLTTLSVNVTHPDFGKIASLKAWRISRVHCRGDFLEIMDEESDEMHQFSVTLFDKYGTVRPHLVDPGSRSGTRCWGRELDAGELVYIEDISVKDTVSSVFCTLALL